MKDKEIVKALRCCASGESEGECPFTEKYGRDGCAKVSADLIERLTAENVVLREKVPQWISVDEKLPELGTRVIATDGVFVGEAIFARDSRWSGYGGGILRDCIGSVVTHWMPLPPVPKEDAK